MTVLQTILMFILITFVFGILIFMALLTWALISPKAVISTRTAGIWIMGCLAGVFLCYTLLMMVN